MSILLNIDTKINFLFLPGAATQMTSFVWVPPSATSDMDTQTPSSLGDFEHFSSVEEWPIYPLCSWLWDFTPSWILLVTWSMIWHRAAAATCHICSSLCPVSSLEPGNGRTNTYRVSWHALTSPSPLARVQSLMFPSLFVIYFSQIFVIIWQLRYFCSVLILLWCVGW